MSLTIAIEETFGIELSGVEVYEYPTIGELAAYLENGGAGGAANGATLAQDAQLDPEIAPRGDATATQLSEASSIFVTGTTGFLGAFLLDQLVQSTGPNTIFYCLHVAVTPERAGHPTGCWTHRNSTDCPARLRLIGSSPSLGTSPSR